MHPKYPLQEEQTSDEGGGGGGGEATFEQSLGASFDSIGQEILSRDEESTGGEPTKAPAKPAEGDKGTTPAQGAGSGERKALPKSWKADYQSHWESLPDPVRDIIYAREDDFLKGAKGYEQDRLYAKSIRDAVAPFQQLLDAQNIKEPAKAVSYLFAAHAALSNPDPKARKQYYEELGRIYNVTDGDGQGLEETNPAVTQLTQEVNNLKTRLSAEDQRRVQEMESAIDAEVGAFAKDPANVYFEELRADIAQLLRGSDTMTLKEAYDRAVWGNPATRAKETTRLQKEQEEKLRKDAVEAADKKRRARGTQVRGQDSEEGPTGFLGSIEDTMRETYRDIQQRQ